MTATKRVTHNDIATLITMSRQIEVLDNPIINKIKEGSPNYQDIIGSLVVNPPGCVLSKLYLKHEDKIRDFQVREDDIWIITFPKAGSDLARSVGKFIQEGLGYVTSLIVSRPGTTWTQEMVWCIINGLNFNEAKATSLGKRVPYLEINVVSKESPDVFEYIDQMKSPRLIKTHLPIELLPKEVWTKKPKIIYVSRDPKDVSISFYHHFKLMNNYIGSFEDFIEAFLSDMVLFSPFWSHVLGYWRRKDEFPIIFNTYEEMKKDLVSVVLKTCRFLGKSYTDTEVESLLDHLSFDKMKENPSVNYEHVVTRKRLTEDRKNLTFFRKGEAGGWKKVMSPELAAQFDAWTAEKLKGSDYEVDTM